MPRIAIAPCRAMADYLESVRRSGGEPMELDITRAIEARTATPRKLRAIAWLARAVGRRLARGDFRGVARRALAQNYGAPSLDDLEKFDFSAEKFEDPLGIAVSWEEKYKKK